MICQILVYGLFIFEIKDRNLLLDFFIFLEFKLGLKKKDQDHGHGEGVQICIRDAHLLVICSLFRNALYIYICGKSYCTGTSCISMNELINFSFFFSWWIIKGNLY